MSKEATLHAERVSSTVSKASEAPRGLTFQELPMGMRIALMEIGEHESRLMPQEPADSEPRFRLTPHRGKSKEQCGQEYRPENTSGG